MKRIGIISFILFFTAAHPGLAQKNRDNSRIDVMIMRGETNRAIDTCRQILASDSLNSEIYYKLGLAYQNLLPDDKSFDCFLKAAIISPDNKQYCFMVAKEYYNAGKINQAEPLLQDLYRKDSMNWSYGYFLTSVYMQKGRYDESINIYNRFLKQDSQNYNILDKIGFACLRKGDFKNAINFYNRSLAINNKNTNALKNLSYLYSSTNRVDTALQLLSTGIKIDPEDIDLYVRRAGLNYLVNYTKRALDDYLKILSTGDSSFLYLKRSGIGYLNNLQPKEALKYLLIAYSKDSSDYETASYLGQIYYQNKDPKNSIRYYKRVIKLLTPITRQMGIATVMLAESQKAGGFYKDAITSYLNALKLSSDNNLYIIIANLYDEKLRDFPKAIYYYETFLDKIKKSNMKFKPDYVESVKKRVEYLKNPDKFPDKKLSENK